MLEEWLVVTTVLLEPQYSHPSFFELASLLAAANKVNSCLRAQVAVQEDMLAALVRLIQTEFNKSFRQDFTSHLPVCWPNFTPLVCTLTTGHFHPGTVTMPGAFRYSLPTAVTTHRSAAPPHKTSSTAH